MTGHRGSLKTPSCFKDRRASVPWCKMNEDEHWAVSQSVSHETRLWWPPRLSRQVGMDNIPGGCSRYQQTLKTSRWICPVAFRVSIFLADGCTPDSCNPRWCMALEAFNLPPLLASVRYISQDHSVLRRGAPTTMPCRLPMMVYSLSYCKLLSQLSIIPATWLAGHNKKKRKGENQYQNSA